jgi:hypothetical protein
MRTTCPIPQSPDFYKEQVEKDMRDTCDHALDMLKKCEVNSDSWDYYFFIVRSYAVNRLEVD